MLNNTFLKTLYQKRWTLFGWCLVIIAMTMLTTMIFPTFRDTFGTSLQEVPESMRAFFGDSDTYKTLAGFVDVQVISQMVFLTIIMAVIMGVGLIAGDEQDKTLQSLLAQPIKRSTIFWQKYIALAVLIAIASLSIFVAVILSALLINESISWWSMLQATFGMFIITLLFGSLSYSLGAVTGKKGLSGSLIGMLAFVSYLITSLAVSVDWLKNIDKNSPFHYFNTPDISIIKYGLDIANISILLAIIIMSTTLGLIVFLRRDINN
jgi:ABC-2 type transport system permease protein